jgi:hypothetical protein
MIGQRHHPETYLRSSSPHHRVFRTCSRSAFTAADWIEFSFSRSTLSTASCMECSTVFQSTSATIFTAFYMECSTAFQSTCDGSRCCSRLALFSCCKCSNLLSCCRMVLGGGVANILCLGSSCDCSTFAARGGSRMVGLETYF